MSQSSRLDKIEAAVLVDGKCVVTGMTHHDAARDAFEAHGGIITPEYTCQEHHPFWKFRDACVDGFVIPGQGFVDREVAYAYVEAELTDYAPSRTYKTLYAEDIDDALNCMPTESR